MAWPRDEITTANVDSDLDSAMLARVQFEQCFSQLNSLMGHPSTFTTSLMVQTNEAGYRVILGAPSSASVSSLQAAVSSLQSAPSVVTSVFTPVLSLSGGTGNVVPSYVLTSGRYQTVGMLTQVQAQFYGAVSSAGRGTGQFVVNLPRPATCDATIQCGAALTNSAINAFFLFGTITSGANAMSLLYLQTFSSGWTSFSGSLQNGAGDRFVDLNFSYRTS